MNEHSEALLMIIFILFIMITVHCVIITSRTADNIPTAEIVEQRPGVNTAEIVSGDTP